MENQLVWNEKYNIGVEIIDREHEKLFHILNKLFVFTKQEEKSHFACQEAIKYFKDYALAHCSDEENYMASIGYEGLNTHRHIHKNFRERTLPALEKELERTNYSKSAISHFLGVCASWLIGHTLVEDHRIVGKKTENQWKNLLPEEEQAVMGQAIISLLHHMFHIHTQLISSYYGGEKFGDGIYYRIIYSNRQAKKLEFYFIFEEQMIAHAIGNVVDIKSKAVSIMMIKVARYLAMQLVEQVKTYLPAAGEFEKKAEQVLTYGQFQQVFQKQNPQFSMLFDTGDGYFAYCMSASDKMHSEDGVLSITKNAMSKIEKCLHMQEDIKIAEKPKKRLLIVDDSDFTLQAMQSLFGSDYEVATAKSGLAAISKITLAKPDLILLDYEMPVCNGRQILEMIRSERKFTDIPVIFLTNKVDEASVKRAIALKPEGYLLKSLSAESVKKEVDRFFEKAK